MTLADMSSPRQVHVGQGAKARVITDVVTIKATAENTGGAYSLFETVTPPSGGFPPHTQRYDDETFYVLDGRYTFLVGEQTVELESGEYLFVPRGTLHAFANAGSGPARMLVLVTPGGIHDRFFEEVGDRADRPAWEPDMPRVLAVAPKYGIEFLPVEPDRKA